MGNNIFIIGFGRFGKLLFDILISDNKLNTKFNIKFYDENKKYKSHKDYKNLQEGVSSADQVFLCVPIRYMQKTISQISSLLKPGSVVIDVCSVKILPCQWMLEGLPENINIIATHPMFGPDSYNINNNNSQIMMHELRCDKEKYNFWRDFFISKNFKILDISPEEHDNHVAYSQGVTHVICRVLSNMKLDKYLNDNKPITKGFESIMHVKQQTCHDSIDLFYDMIKFNPYSKEMLSSLNLSVSGILLKLID